MPEHQPFFQHIRYRSLFLFLIPVLAFSACKPADIATNSTNKNRDEKLTQAEQLQLTALYIDGVREKSLDNYDKALGLFAQCVKRNGKYAPALYEMASILEQRHQYSDALVMATSAVKGEPGNEWYQLLLTNIYIDLNDYGGAAKTMNQLCSQFPGNPDYRLNLADIYIMDGKFMDAIKVYDEVEKKLGVTEDVSLQKEKLYLQMNKSGKAIEEIEALVKEFPSEVKYMIILADLYLTTGSEMKGLSLYEQILSISPDNPYVHISLADYYRMQNNEEKSFSELKLAFASPDMDIDSKVRILLQYYQLSAGNPKLLEQAYTLCQITTQTHPDEAKAWSIYGDFLNRDKRTEEAAEVFRKVIELDGSRYAVWEELLYMDSSLGKFDLLLKESQQAMDLFPEQAEPYLYYGFANIRLKHPEDAVKALRKGLSFATGDPLLLKFYANLGEAYYMLNELDLSFENYEKALKIDPENVFILNNYSFFLAVHKRNLSRAEELSRKLIKLEPNNPTFEDTHAWVCFMQEKYDQARQLLEQALEHGGAKSPAILEHYGDVLYKLNEPDRALEYWKKAAEAGEPSELLKKKISNKMWYEK